MATTKELKEFFGIGEMPAWVNFIVLPVAVFVVGVFFIWIALGEDIEKTSNEFVELMPALFWAGVIFSVLRLWLCYPKFFKYLVIATIFMFVVYAISLMDNRDEMSSSSSSNYSISADDADIAASDLLVLLGVCIAPIGAFYFLNIIAGGGSISQKKSMNIKLPSFKSVIVGCCIILCLWLVFLSDIESNNIWVDDTTQQSTNGIWVEDHNSNTTPYYYYNDQRENEESQQEEENSVWQFN